jgi:hypothetical protein
MIKRSQRVRNLVVMNVPLTPRINGPLSKVRKFPFAITNTKGCNTLRKAISVVRLFKCIDVMPDLNFSRGNSEERSHPAPPKRLSRKGLPV